MTAPPSAPTTSQYWCDPLPTVLDAAGTTPEGLTADEAERRRGRDPDPLGEHRRRPALRVLLEQFTSPISLVLIAATILSMALGDTLDGTIILLIILASGLLGFWQEYRADAAVAELLASVQVTSRVLRSGALTEVRIGDVVVGDIVDLTAGDLVPADCRLLTCEQLLIDASALTGEAFPVEKDADAGLTPATPLAARSTAAQFGSHVLSGHARAVVVAIGRDTEFGRVTRSVGAAAVRTAFELGVARFGWLLVRIVAVLTVLVFAVNWAFGRPALDSLLFSLSLAVGITPQMLPAIVSVSLATGARRLAAKRVVVKRLDAIEDLGAITLVCTDKTGTLTTGETRLESAIDIDGRPNDRVLGLAALNAGGQRGFRNPLDDAIARVRPVDAVAIAELPYDFQRKRLSVLVPGEQGPVMVTKGAVDSVLAVCTRRASSDPDAWAADRDRVRALADRLNAAGDRVLALASKPMPGPSELTPGDEADLVLEGLLVFADPPKATARASIEGLRSMGVDVAVITGDSAASARAIAAAVGLDGAEVVTGAQLEQKHGTALRTVIRSARVFAEIGPSQKERIVTAFRSAGEVVAFLGDGINDAPALHAADVGISVDSAVDIAKQASSVVLLEKDLGVLEHGVRLGRQTFANTLKYIRLTISANFGNMISLAIARLALPFLPLLPRQILVLNFLSDIPSLLIAGDTVDAEELARPVEWDVRAIQRFMILFGLLSTVFDLMTFGVLFVFGANETMFHSCWFVMSTLTELAVLFSLRTARPFWRSRPATGLLITSVVVAVATGSLPFVPFFADVLGLTPPDPMLSLALVGVLVLYVAANELAKKRLLRRAAGPSSVAARRRTR
jgi:Mg2+-importing ATPase